MQALLDQRPDLTLKELRQAMGLGCSLQALHVRLKKMGLTYKKRSGPASKTVRTSPAPAGAGVGNREGSIRRGWSSSMNRGRKPT